MRHQFFARAIAIVTAWGVVDAHGASEYDALAPYLADDVTAVARIRLDRVDFEGVVKELEDYGVPRAALNIPEGGVAKSHAWVREMVGYGVPTMVAVFHTADVFQHGSAWVLPVAASGSPEKAAGLLLSNEPGKQSQRGNRSEIFPNVARQDEGAVVAAMNDEQLAAIKRRTDGVVREEFAAALEALGDADVAIALVGDADSRRVFREMWPAAPAPFAEIDGKLLADGVKFIGIGIDLPPDPQVRLVVEANSDDAAKVVAQALEKLRIAANAFALAEMVNGAPDHRARGSALLALLPLMEPKSDGRRTTIALGDTPGELDSLRMLLGPAARAARQAAASNRRMNNFKQIALAMLNYESAKKSYPPAAICDKDGKPLLSWRVAVLPYLEGGELYKEFHLDEPWDSPHNLKLVEQMPGVYAEPDPILAAQIGKGRTTFQVPRGEGTLFAGNEGVNLREVKDGTSNTVLTVEVVPKRAVPWTKPDDWQLDPADPLAGLKRTDRDRFTMGRCDGSVQMVPNTVDPANWKKLLTPAGGEVVEPF